VIDLKNINKSFSLGEETIKAIDNVTFTINKGEFVSIIGPSGSGKSTLMNILGLLDVPDSGEYILDGINVSKAKENKLAEIRNNKIGFIFQNFNLLPKMTAVENIQIPLIYQGKSNEDSRKRAYELLDKVGLKGREKHLPAQLSGGQQQRVAIARALASKPAIILLDEPTGNLDAHNSKEVVELLKISQRKFHQTVILVTHDDVVASVADRIITLEDGKIIFDSDTNQQS